MEKTITPRPVLAMLLGRGGTGKSTLALEIISRARNGGRDPIIVDGDLRSATLGPRFPEAIRPASEETPDSKAMLTLCLNRMLAEGRSAVVDLGGGDKLLMEYDADIPIIGFCQSAGIDPVAIYVMGPEAEDLSHAYTIWKAGYFRPERTVFMLNEGAIRLGKGVKQAFDPIMADARFREMVGAGGVGLLVAKLAAMDFIKDNNLDFYVVAAAGGGTVIDPVHQYMIKAWVMTLERKRQDLGIDTWLP